MFAVERGGGSGIELSKDDGSGGDGQKCRKSGRGHYIVMLNLDGKNEDRGIDVG